MSAFLSSRRVRPFLGGLAIATLVLAGAVPAAAERPRVYAITGATVIPAPGEQIESATVVIRDGLIEAVGASVAVPPDAEVIDGTDLTVWAGWIDAYSHLGMPAPQGGGGGFNIAALLQQRPPAPGTGHPIELVHPQHRVTDELVAGEGAIENHREIGFTAALTVPRDGIFRGWSALIALRDGAPRDLVVQPRVSQHVGFDRGSFLGGYPSDLLGSIATIRQVHYDTVRYMTWKARYDADPLGMTRPPYNDAFEALAERGSGSHFIVTHAGSNRMIERAMRLGDEFGVGAVLLGGGDEQQIVDQLRDRPYWLIVPVDFPDDPDVSSAERLPSVSLESLHRWERAAANAGRLEQAGVTFALTPYGMGNVSKFTENLRKAIAAGLSEAGALAALTTVPARMVGADDAMGTIEAGKIANLVVATGAPFAEETEIRHVFVDGHRYEFEEQEQVGNPDAVVDPRGEWAVTIDVMGQSQNATWTIEGSSGAYGGRSVSDQGEQTFDSVELEGDAMTVSISGPMGSLEVTVVIDGEAFSGSASVDGPGGQTFTLSFKGERVSGPEGGVR